MNATIVARTDSGFIPQIEVPYKDSMLEAEDALQEAPNHAGEMNWEYELPEFTEPMATVTIVQDVADAVATVALAKEEAWEYALPAFLGALLDLHAGALGPVLDQNRPLGAPGGGVRVVPIFT